MVAMIEDYVLDNGLLLLRAGATHLTICGSEPTTYSIATVTGLLGYKSWGASNVFGAPAASAAPTGRKVSSVAITDGTITTSGTANWWAAVDETNSRLLVHGTLSASQVVTAGNTFSLGSFDIKIADQ